MNLFTIFFHFSRLGLIFSKFNFLHTSSARPNSSICIGISYRLLAEVEQSIIQAELTKIAVKGTLDLIYADFNNHVADLIQNEKSKNSKYDETKFENKKNLYILGLKHIFAQIG
ncbi:hypothetical protein, partial [Streptobacillus notomytis]|uniref:hypothetical protein n=1 Tax=Streptobacillus notomytis TaxID=1712031 RepID=UPI0015D66EEA